MSTDLIEYLTTQLLNACTASHCVLVRVFSHFQNEISELKEQITMYESASQYGVFSAAGSTASHISVPKHELEDSYAQLNIKKAISDIDTPNSAR